MVAVSPDHFTGITDRPVIECLCVGKVLPSRLTLDHHDPQLVASIQKCRILRIMSRSHRVKPILLDLQGISVLHGIRRCVSYILICLMPVRAAQIYALTVEIESVSFKINGSDSRIVLHLVNLHTVLVYLGDKVVEIWIIDPP